MICREGDSYVQIGQPGSHPVDIVAKTQLHIFESVVGHRLELHLERVVDVHAETLRGVAQLETVELCSCDGRHRVVSKEGMQ